ncbi:MAG: NAD(P)H-dependent glycerol-3-phosphate dehydrogenase [bacterium]
MIEQFGNISTLLHNPKIGVIGAGSWGTTLASVLSKKEYDVTLWVYEKELADIIRTQRANTYYLPQARLPDSLNITTSLSKATENKDIILSVVPAQVVREVTGKYIQFLKPGTVIVSASKGIENRTGKRITQIIKELLSDDTISLAVLSGPTFATEIIKGLPAAAVLAYRDNELGRQLQEIFSTGEFRIYLNNDPIGVEFGGALKNIMAIATGISDGLQFGYNTRAALITRGLVEMIRLATAVGAKEETLRGLSGLGDLILTCTGDLSRNRGVGIKIGQGMCIDTILSQMHMVAEGVETTRAVFKLAQEKEIEMPITEQVYAVLFENKSPATAVSDLMNRSLKPE